MKKELKKRGQKFLKRFSRASEKAGENSREHIKENFINRLSHIESIRLLILEWGLLVAALILLALTQAFWFNDSYSEDSFTKGGVYTEATLGEVNSLNPIFAVTNSEKTLSRLLFSTLATVDYSGNVGVGLAKTIHSDENGKVWTVAMKEGLKWSDGEPITSDDVLFTINLIKNPATNSVYDANFTNVEVKKNEKEEIVFTLKSPYADFMSALIVPILPKHCLENTDPKTLIEDKFSNGPITSGAFSLNAMQAGSNEESIYYLSSNPYYYKGEPLLSSFSIHTYNSIDNIIGAINSSSVTATAELDESVLGSLKNRQFLYKNSSIKSGAYLFFNTTSAKVKNKDLRSAIREGIDISEVRKITNGAVAMDYPILESQIKLDAKPTIPAYNFENAKTKIAGIINDETKNLKLVTVKSGYLPEIANKIAEFLHALGFEVEVSIQEENQDFINNTITQRNYDILIYEIELGADPDPLAYYHSSQASSSGLNLSNYRNTLVDDLLLGARNTLDETLRTKKYETFLEYWVGDVPAIGLYQVNLTYFYNENTRTYSNDVRLVTQLDRFSDVENWAVNKVAKNKTP